MTDLVKRDFKRDGPNQLWVTDITEHPTREGKIYCCAVIDAYSRRVVGWAIDSRQRCDLATSALGMAIDSRGADGQIPGGSFTATTASSSPRGPSPNEPAKPTCCPPWEASATPTTTPSSYRIPLTGPHEDAPGVLVQVAVRPREGRRVVEISLINAQIEPSSHKDTAWLFQSRLTVTALDGVRAVFLPIDDPGDDLEAVTGDPEELHLRLLYRGERRYAAGRNVAVHAETSNGQRAAYRLVTTWMPTYDVPATVAPSGPGTPMEHVELSMDALAAADPAQLRHRLLPLVDGYTEWLDARELEVPSLPDGLKPAAVKALHDARMACARIAAGVKLLTDPAEPGHGEALRAFRFANEAMALQRRHTEIGRRREKGFTYQQAAAAVQGREVASWRPFQLAFVLLNLPSLTDPGHPERCTDAMVDLLFFPTGGGKTEAYLGLTAYTFAIRRLQGVIGAGADARSGLAGVAVLMRYTLRLLTAQQFQRAAALVCAAETLRRGDPAIWGEEPFRIGLWVGASVAPNWFDEAEEQIKEARDGGRAASVLQTVSCPWCGDALRADRDLRIDPDRRRILLYCPNGEGVDACPFSARMSPGEGLPVLTVDEEIYRYAPSLVIATVDKLAQLPWNGYAGSLFCRVRSRCERPGQPGQLLIRGQEPLPHDRGRRHGEVDRPEQTLVQLGPLGAQLIRRRRGQPDHVYAAERPRFTVRRLWRAATRRSPLRRRRRSKNHRVGAGRGSL